MRLFAALAALATLQGGAAPNPRSANPDPQSAVRNPQSQLVCIDVIPSDARGRIVDTLKAADFSLLDDGAPQPLESVRFIRPTADASRLVAIFLDEYHVSAAATLQVRTSIARFVEQDLRPQDLLVVMKPLDSLFAIRLTQDRTEALQAIESFEGRSGEYAPRNAYERNFMAGGPARLEQARTQVVLSAINALAVHFASFTEQRKTLIVVSEGMTQGERRRGMEFLPTVETIVRSAQDSNVSIYAVSPKAEAADNDALHGLAVETMGQVTTVNLEDGLTRALQDASGYYLLTYRVSRPDDGKFHAVQVQIKRAAMAVRARKGYFAPSPDAALRAALLAQMNAPKPVVPVEPAPHTSVLIRSWFGTSRGANGKTRVTFVWEPAARLTGERNRHTPTRVVLSALAPDNAVLFEGTVNATGPGQTDDGAVVPSRAVFEMAPGRLRLRMSIQDAAQQVLDTDVRSISIREMRGVCIGTPEILRARNAREFRALESEAAVPVASREFSRAERLLIRFSTYGASTGPLTVTARLLSRMGPMRTLDVTSVSNHHQIDLSLAGLATGEYVVELSATGGGGDAKDVVDFRVTT
jgi:VWFA-related protein